MEKPDDTTLLGTKANSQWLRRLLFPFWICRILLLVLMGVAQIASVYWISQELDIRGSILASLIVVVLFAVLCISLDAVSMILLGRNALKPAAFLVLQIIETTLWTAIIGVEIMAAIKTSSKSRSFLTWLISAVLYVSFISLLVYAGILFHRSRRSASKRGLPAQHGNGSDHSLHNRTLSPASPFDNAYAASAHSRNTSVASLESVFLAPPPYESSRGSTPQSSNSFTIITPPKDVADT